MGDVITRFKLETTQYDSALRDATSRMKELMHNVQAAGGSLNDLSAKDKELARSFGTLSTGANNAKDRVKELTRDFNSLARQYNAMTAEMQKSDVGRDIASQMQVMKQRLSEAKQELYSVSSAGESFDSVLQTIGGQLGINSQLMGALTSGTLATTAAITAGAAAVAAATKMWADYNDELNRQTNVTTVTTGLKGDDAENLTIGVRALAKTYDVDFREAINAANTLIQQFGVSGEQALSLIQDGMQGMIAGDGGKLLSMIQQYAPSFRDAGIEASQLVAIIQNSEGGLFTDQNMNAIVMGIRNIRLMTEQTSKALAQLGIDGEEMNRKLNDGSMTIFEAMQQVSTAIENAGSSSQAVGQVMQQVFGRQGTAAGTNLAKAIETLNTNLEETKTQTGELGESFVKLNDANVRLENTMKEVFGMTGWEDMNNLIKTDLANTLSDVLEIVGGIRDAIKEIGTLDGFETLAKTINKATGGLLQANGQLKDIQNAIAFIKGLTGGGSSGTLSGTGKGIGASVNSIVSAAKGNQSKGFSITTDSKGNVIKATRDGKDVTEDYLKNKNRNTNPPPPKPTVTIPKGGSKIAPWAPIAMGEFTGIDITGRSVNDVTKDIQAAQAKFNAAGDEIGRSMAKAMIEALQKEKDTMMNEGDVTKGGFADAYSHDFGKDIKGLESQMKNADNLAKQGQDVRESWQQAAGAIGSVGNALAGLEDPGAKIIGTVGQAIAQIALGFAQATAADSKLGVFGWIAAVAGGLGTMISTISAIKSATGYANGGVVNYNGGGGVIPGNSYTGDNLRMIGVNSGEIIMNTAQQNNVANALLSRQQGGVDVQPWVDGEKVYLGMNNTLQRKGKGEIVTTSMLRQKGIL